MLILTFFVLNIKLDQKTFIFKIKIIGLKIDVLDVFLFKIKLLLFFCLVIKYNCSLKE